MSTTKMRLSATWTHQSTAPVSGYKKQGFLERAAHLAGRCGDQPDQTAPGLRLWTGRQLYTSSVRLRVELAQRRAGCDTRSAKFGVVTVEYVRSNDYPGRLLTRRGDCAPVLLVRLSHSASLLASCKGEVKARAHERSNWTTFSRLRRRNRLLRMETGAFDAKARLSGRRAGGGLASCPGG